MMTLKEKQIQNVEKETYDLVKGEFSPAEASEIVNDLFSKKINFHELNSFSQIIRFDSKDLGTQQRIMELKLHQKHAMKLIKEAEEAGKSLRVNSTISIEVI